MRWLYHTVGDTLDPKWGNCDLPAETSFAGSPWWPQQPICPVSRTPQEASCAGIFADLPYDPLRTELGRFSQQARHLLGSWLVLRASLLSGALAPAAGLPDTNYLPAPHREATLTPSFPTADAQDPESSLDVCCVAPMCYSSSSLGTYLLSSDQFWDLCLSKPTSLTSLL